MKLITIDGAMDPAGHYSPATIAGNIICISGQLPIDPYTGEKCVGGIKAQAEQVLKNIDTILHAANADKNDVMKVTIYVSDISLWNDVNELYAKYFGNHKPARVVVPTRELHYGFLIEMDAMAYKD